MPDRPETPRARARAETIAQIKDTARSHLATDGADLSLRAVARDLGIVSSAVYRYFPSRDDLLTALILDAYAALGEAAETADAALRRGDLLGRWTAVGHAIRDWARGVPHEYALVYGTPVPGYHAPTDTVAQSQRPLTVMTRILVDGVERGAIAVPADRLPRAVRADVAAIAELPGFAPVPVTLLARGMTVWAQLFGTITFELFGRYNNAVHDLDAYFAHELRGMARYLGLA